MKPVFTYLCILLLLVIGLLIQGVISDEINSTESVNQSALNNTTSSNGIEYPEDGIEAAEGVAYGISAQGYADVGGISTGFSGSSIEGEGNNLTPSAVMSFSDKSSVSGFIHNFMKSFHYESGVDL